MSSLLFVVMEHEKLTPPYVCNAIYYIVSWIPRIHAAISHRIQDVQYSAYRIIHRGSCAITPSASGMETWPTRAVNEPAPSRRIAISVFMVVVYQVLDVVSRDIV